MNKLLQGMLNNAHTSVMLEIAADNVQKAIARRDWYMRLSRPYDEALRASDAEASATSTRAGGGNG